jgi:acetate kinase
MDPREPVAVSILVLNAGSSSLKFGLFDDEARGGLASGFMDWTDPGRAPEIALTTASGGSRRSPIDGTDHRSAAALAIRAVFEADDPTLGRLADVRAVGHRVVHGGTEFVQSVPIDHAVRQALARLGELAPLHNPPALEGIASAEGVLPGVPHVAVFDTAFFARLPPERYVYPLPYSWYADWGVRRFGFHGISHAYVASRAAEMLGRDDLRVVSCHLGNGCSAAASRGGVGVETTMGYTPMDGLMMGTRPGSVDPGALLHALRTLGVTPDELDDVLNHRSGLLGVSGLSPDFRAVADAAERGHERAGLALGIYAVRIRGAIGAMAAALGGVDALVFTAGVGEHAAKLRAEVCRGLEFLGLRLDEAVNSGAHPDADVAAPDSPARILVVRTREDLLIAREARRFVS